MNWKIILLSGLAFLVATQLVSMITGMFIHDGILREAYDATASAWRPELMQDPPDMKTLMPMWLFNGAVMSLVIAAVYGFVRTSFTGPGWKRGLTYGLILTVLYSAYHLGLSGYFDLPGEIWLWWSVDALIVFCIGTTALGLVAERLTAG